MAMVRHLHLTTNYGMIRIRSLPDIEPSDMIIDIVMILACPYYPSASQDLEPHKLAGLLQDFPPG